MRSFTIALVAAVAAFAAVAEAPRIPVVTGAWARATPPGTPVAAIYLTIDNSAGKADRLLSVSSDRADRAEVHAIVRDGDVVKMRRVDPLHVGAGERVMLEPGGTHLMLMGLQSPLVEGEILTVVMKFELAGEMRVTARVMAPTAPDPHAAHHHE
jgi:copper(I)-binding protein